MSAEKDLPLLPGPITPPLLTPDQDCLMYPRAHSPLLLRAVSGDRLIRTGALWVLEHWTRGPLRGGFHSSQGGLSSLKVLTTCPCPSSQVPSLPAFLPELHLRPLTCCQHASAAQEQSHAHGKCHRSGNTPRGPGECCSPKGRECLSSPSSAPQGSLPSSTAAGSRQELGGAMAP